MSHSALSSGRVELQEQAIDTAATFNPLADPVPVAEAASWPIAQAAAAEDSPLKRVRLDVGWQLWSAEPEGMDMQYQVCHERRD